MERVEFLIEKTNTRLPCLLNPENLTIQRTSGVQRSSAQLVNHNMSDNPVSFSGRGDTRFQLELLFDLGLPGLTFQTDDIRDVTGGLWDLTEYKGATGQFEELPSVRFIWGRIWNIRVVVESVSEKYIRFSRTGKPQASQMTVGLIRISEDETPQERPRSPYTPTEVNESRELLDAAENTTDWGVHVLLEDERLSQLAARYYGYPDLWRLIAVANNIDNPLSLLPGLRLRIPPLSVLQ
jgi:hypothetical protein